MNKQPFPQEKAPLPATQLTEHFSLAEMTRSGVAVKHGLDNRPSKMQTDNLRNLCVNVLEPLRRHFGRIIITSGYRSVAVNSLVGGAPDSQHLRGEAADIYLASEEKCRRYVDFIRQHTDFDQLLLEPLNSKYKRWLHVSYTTRRPNRHQVVASAEDCRQPATRKNRISDNRL